MAEKYRITAIHAELLEELAKGRSMVYHIDDWDVLKGKIRYQSYDASAPLVGFLLENGINLMPDGKEKRSDRDLHNTVSIREFINNINSWSLSCFIRDKFAPLIRLGLGRWKDDEVFGNLCNVCVDELTEKGRLINQVVKEGRTPFLSDYLSSRKYMGECRYSATQRWEVFRFAKDYCGISRQQYIRIDYVFGMADLFNENYVFFEDYIYNSWKRLGIKMQAIMEQYDSRE